MEPVTYPSITEIHWSHWSEDFQFQPTLIKEVQEKFPDWKDLHKASKRNDKGKFWGLLYEYRNRLVNIKPEEIIAAFENGETQELIDRAQQAADFKKFLEDIELQYLE